MGPDLAKNVNMFTWQSVDPDQNALQEQFDLGLYCLLRPVCPRIHSKIISNRLFV